VSTGLTDHVRAKVLIGKPKRNLVLGQAYVKPKGFLQVDGEEKWHAHFGGIPEDGQTNDTITSIYSERRVTHSNNLCTTTYTCTGAIAISWAWHPTDLKSMDG